MCTPRVTTPRTNTSSYASTCLCSRWLREPQCRFGYCGAVSAPPPRTEHHPSDSRPRRRLLQQPQRLDEETGTGDALTVSPRSLAEGRYQSRDCCHGWGSEVLSAQHILRITSSPES